MPSRTDWKQCIETANCLPVRGPQCNYGADKRVEMTVNSLVKSVFVRLIAYRTIILPVVLYGCETWSLTLREERRVRVFENRVLRGIFGPKCSYCGEAGCA